MTRIRFNALNAVDMGVGIVLSINVPIAYKNAVQTILERFKPNSEYEIKAYKEKRSLSANAYCWVLADKLAEKLRSTKESVYRFAIRQVGVFTNIRVADEKAAKRFTEVWESNGIGWITEPIDDTTIQAYYGSSSYNTHEMARLVEFLQDECRRQNIEVRPQEEVDSMLKMWEER